VAIDVPAVVVAGATVEHLSTLGAGGVSAVSAWGGATGFSPIEPKEDAAPPSKNDPKRADRLVRIETTLREARVPLDVGDRTALAWLRASVAAAYQEARAHPEDPEAPWLVAEGLRTLARVEELAGDPEGAKALRSRASLLDSGRVIGLSEGGTATTSVTMREVEIAFLGAPTGAIARIDGRALSTNTKLHEKLAAGEHHLRVVAKGDGVLDGPTMYASWFVVTDADTQTMSIRVAPDPVACSMADLSRAGANESFEVSCTRWARVKKLSAVAVEVRLCGTHGCAPATTWMVPTTPKTPPVTTEPPSVWRSGWTYAAIGAAAVIAGSVTAWRLGAFDRPEAPPPTWRWEGTK